MWRSFNIYNFFDIFMAIDDAIKKLETSNDGLKVIIENLDEQLKEIRLDPRLEGLVDDLENLFYAYLKTWIKSNTEILEILRKEKK
jgi:hypothetical protein